MSGRSVRLFYPNSVPSALSAGNVSTISNPALVTAQTLADSDIAIGSGSPAQTGAGLGMEPDGELCLAAR